VVCVVVPVIGLVTPLWPLDGKPTYSRKAPPVSKFCGRVVWSGVIAVYGVVTGVLTALTALTAAWAYLIHTYINTLLFERVWSLWSEGASRYQEAPSG